MFHLLLLPFSGPSKFHVSGTGWIEKWACDLSVASLNPRQACLKCIWTRQITPKLPPGCNPMCCSLLLCPVLVMFTGCVTNNQFFFHLSIPITYLSLCWICPPAPFTLELFHLASPLSTLLGLYLCQTLAPHLHLPEILHLAPPPFSLWNGATCTFYTSYTFFLQ